MLKRYKVVLIGFLVLALMAPVMAWAGEFPDVSAGHWANKAINEMANLGILMGDPDGNFYPDNPVTRAQFAAMIIKSLKLPMKMGSKAVFSDVPKGHWAYGVIEAANKAGFVTGYQGKFRPEDKITRQEMAVVIMNISSKYGYPGEGSTNALGKYKDIDLVSSWAAPAISDATRFGYIQEVSYSVYESAYESHRFNRVLAPLDNATRAQAAFALHKMLIKTGLI